MTLMVPQTICATEFGGTNSQVSVYSIAALIHGCFSNILSDTNTTAATHSIHLTLAFSAYCKFPFLCLLLFTLKSKPEGRERERELPCILPYIISWKRIIKAWPHRLSFVALVKSGQLQSWELDFQSFKLQPKETWLMPGPWLSFATFNFEELDVCRSLLVVLNLPPGMRLICKYGTASSNLSNLMSNTIVKDACHICALWNWITVMEHNKTGILCPHITQCLWLSHLDCKMRGTYKQTRWMHSDSISLAEWKVRK